MPTNKTYNLYLPDVMASTTLAQQLASILPQQLYCYFSGAIGTGKTTFIRALLRALAITGPIKSPTFTIIEPYNTAKYTIYHMDLYRLENANMLAAIDWREYFSKNHVCLVEWPEHGKAYLPIPDLQFKFALNDAGRTLSITPASQHGIKIIKTLGIATKPL